VQQKLKTEGKRRRVKGWEGVFVKEGDGKNGLGGYHKKRAKETCARGDAVKIENRKGDKEGVA